MSASQSTLSLNSLLKSLQTLIKKLPTSLPCGAKEGVIAQYFTDHSWDEDEGPFFTFNQNWERVFQRSGEDVELLVVRGKYGIELAYSYALHFAGLPRINDNNGLLLVAKRVQDLMTLVKIVTAKEASKVTTRSADISKRTVQKRKRDDNAESDSDARNEASQTENDSHGSPSHSSGTVKSKGNRQKKKAKKIPAEEYVSDASIEEITSTNAGRNPKKARWAFTLYTDPKPVTKGGLPFWKWICKYCPKYRTTKRTPGCTNYANEKLKPNSSNFISHAASCKHIPPSKSFLAFEQPESGMIIDRDHDFAPTGVLAQQEMMQGFTARGLANPEKVVSRKGFREHLVKGMLEDDLPFSFGEKPGMKKVFTYLLPQNIKAPSHQTVRRDLDLLYDVLDKKVTSELQENKSQLALASDQWTTKNSVFAMVGETVFFIDKDWNLRNRVLALIPLKGDHSGKTSAKLLFKSLKHRGIGNKISSHGADNTASNNTLNRALSKLLHKHCSKLVEPKNLQVGCTAHVLNISSQAIFFGMGMGDADDPEVKDYYEAARAFPSTYSPESDPEVMEEMERAAAEAQADMDDDDIVMAESSESDTYSEDEEDGLEDGDDDDEVIEASSSAKTKSKKRLSCVGKLHEIVVDILRSDVKRKRFRCVTRKYCSAKYRHLVLIRSMKIRWNTTYFEILRALDLKPAVNQWVEQMNEGLTGKLKAAATRRQKRLRLSPDEWETLTKLCGVLKHYHEATLELSRADKPTICMALPLLKIIQQNLQTALEDPDLAKDKSGTKFRGLKAGLKAGLAKIDTYIKKALEGDFPLLGAVRLRYFEDTEKWDTSNAERIRSLLQKYYDAYKKNEPSPSKPSPAQSAEANVSVFMQAIRGLTPDDQREVMSEIEQYFSGIYPCLDEDSLKWWKMHAAEFPVLARIARDILAIPGVSISVERLFSSCKHTLSDSRSSMTSSSASKAVVVKEWIKAGFGDGVQYLDDFTLRG